MTNTIKTQTTVLDAVIKIYETLEGSKLCEKAISSVLEELKLVEEYLDCTSIQGILFSIIFSIQNKDGKAVTFGKIVEHLDESFLHLIKYKKDINELLRNNLLNTAGYNDYKSEDSSFIVCKNVIDCIIEGEPLPEKFNYKDTKKIFYELNELFTEYCSRRSPSDEYISNINEMEKKYAENKVIKNIIKIYPDNEQLEERIFVYSLCFRVINGSDYQDSGNSCDGFNFKIFPTKNILRFENEITENTFKPLKDDYAVRKLVLEETSFRGRGSFTFYSLTQKGIETFFGEESSNYEAEENVLSDMDILKQFLLIFASNYESRRKNIFSKTRNLTQIEKNYSDIDFVKKINEIIKDKVDRFILYDCCSDFVNYGGMAYLTSTLKDIYGEDAMFFKKVHEYKDEKSFLQTEGFLDLDRNENIDKSTLSLSDRTYELIYGKNADLYVKTIGASNIFEPAKLKEKSLFYTPEIIKQVDMLKKSLDNKNLITMQERLEAKALPKGVCCLLYGAAGTGKTESVYQIAKATNRKIYHVDISETKSMWFGESEKLIKKIFINYKGLCKTCERRHENAPILLFNKADAIISKRKSVDSGNVAQTENAIQNIILEQMENLDGIMIATTNLCENMDKAFERRFLFKIKFTKPGLKERMLIWKDKLPLLSDEEAEKIAHKYDFSGGEIDNIVRKCEIDEVINGEIPDYEKIEELCKFERLSIEGSRPMGFAV